MAEVTSLLPDSATPWMRAVEAASVPAWPVPVDLIRDALDPHASPAHLLASLAFENSVDIWGPDWSESKQRNVIDQSPALHRLKGTLAGIEAYVAIAGGEVLRSVAPPQGVFAGGQDPKAKAAWLKRFPEFRVFTSSPWEEDFSDAYPGEAFAGGGDDHGFAAPTPSNTRLQTRAGLLIRDGVEIQMSRREAVSIVDGVERLVETYVPTETDLASAFAGQAWANDFIDTTPALPALALSLDLVAGGAHVLAGTAFRGPFLDATPERVSGTAREDAGAYPADYLDAAYTDRGIDPAVLSYDRWRLADPQRSAGASAPDDSFFGDQTFLGLSPFTLLLDVHVNEALPPMTTQAGGFEGDFLHHHDRRRTDLVLEAIASAAADRDQVLVRFARHRPLRLGDRPTLPVRLGQLVTDF